MVSLLFALINDADYVAAMAVIEVTVEARRFFPRRAFVRTETGTLVLRVRRSWLGRGTAARAHDVDGQRWSVRQSQGTTTLAREGSVVARASGMVLTSDDATYIWRVADHGSREARITSRASGQAVLHIRASDTSCATMQIDAGVEQAWGFAAAALAHLLKVGGSGRFEPPKQPKYGSPYNSGGGGGYWGP